MSARGVAETVAVAAADETGGGGDAAVAVGAAVADGGDDDPENRKEVNAWQAITMAATSKARPQFEYSLDRSSFRSGR